MNPKSNESITDRRYNVLFKRLPILVIKLLGIVMRRLLSTHIVDGPAIRIKKSAHIKNIQNKRKRSQATKNKQTNKQFKDEYV